MQEAIPGQSAYGDAWHMHNDLNKAIGAYMYTLLTGLCDVGDEPCRPGFCPMAVVDGPQDRFRNRLDADVPGGSGPGLQYTVDADGDDSILCRL